MSSVVFFYFCYIDVLWDIDLLKNKAHPSLAADGVLEWVERERKMKERLLKEKAAREQRDKTLVSHSLTTSFVVNLCLRFAS